MPENEISLWEKLNTESKQQFNDTVSGMVDVAIIGGGFTGLSTALHCSLAGLACHVIEAKHIGYGGSGRNVGLVNAGVWLSPKLVVKSLGDKYGNRFVERFSQAPNYVFNLIEKYQIKCDTTRTGTIHAAHSPSGFRNLKLLKFEWDKLAQPVDLLTSEQTSELTGTNIFYGALLDHRAGTINPMDYCIGLANAAKDAGSKISTKVRATDLKRVSRMWNVQTSEGHLKARFVVICTNAYTDELWPNLQKTFSSIDYFQFATQPLGDQIKNILPQRHGLWDTGRIMFSLRRDSADRLVLGSMGSVIGDKNKGLSKRWATKKLNKLFPELGNVSFENAWHGRIALTQNHLPQIHKLGKNLYTPIGYNGRGITTGTIMGQALADLFATGTEKRLPVPISKEKTFLFSHLISSFYRLVFAANQLIRSIWT